MHDKARLRQFRLAASKRVRNRSGWRRLDVFLNRVIRGEHDHDMPGYMRITQEHG